MNGRSPFGAIVVRELGRAKGRLALALLAMLGYTAATLLTPWPIKVVFDQVLLEKPLPASLDFLAPVLERGEVVALVAVALAMILIALVRGGLAYAQVAITSRVGYEVMYALRRELFAHLQRLSLAFHRRSRSGELLTKVTSDTGTLKDAFAEWALLSVGDALTLGGMFAVMLFVDWRLALVPLLSFPVVLLTLRTLYRRTKVSARNQRRGEGRIAARASEVLGAVALVQAFGRERYEEEQFEREGTQTLDESVRTARLEAAASRSVELITGAATSAVLVLGALQVRRGAMTPGELLVFLGYLSSMYKPIKSLAKLSTKISKATVSAERINELLEAEPDIVDAPGAVALESVRGAIEFRSVRFEYAHDSVLEDVSLRIEPGQRVALVGVSGAGKSTIASLLLRLYDPSAGSVALDGVDVKRYSLHSLRRQIAIVPQESLLLGATIRENIAYGRTGASEAAIEAAARAANAHGFIARLERGYDTVVGERGETLSGGERRRIAIARALLRDAPIVILDEPMSGLDVESEAAVREALARLTAGRTCLLITHDLRAAADADLVFLLERGRIAARGRHDELLTSSLGYRRLVELQAPPVRLRTARELLRAALASGRLS